MRVDILFDRLRWEEKALKEEADSLGADAALTDVKGLALEVSKTGGPRAAGIALQRCISHQRALLVSRILEGQGVPVINSAAVAEVCGNKLATTIALSKAKVPTPRTMVALSSEGVMGAAEELGFPVVLKPFSGSWGRMVTIVRDRETLQSVVELREELPNPMEHMFYLQEYVHRPPRDIRVVVAGDQIAACVFRHAPEGEWRTNVARGGRSEAFSPDSVLQETVLRAAACVGGGVLGVDAMESPNGYLVHEVNNTVEFRGAQSAVSWSIPRKIMEYVLGEARK
jgi:[lysine-biosynthesis-protein LysW]---L-2-aminoadipate ligase